MTGIPKIIENVRDWQAGRFDPCLGEEQWINVAGQLCDEIERLQSDVKVAEIGNAFGKVAVAERNLVQHKLAEARAEITRLKEDR